MRVFTHTCTACGTVVAANVLESNRVMKCPGLDCGHVLRFEDLPRDHREYFLDHADRYEL